jgi:type I restriction enzyme S subunit
MNGERLLKHYERIADAPDAIARLRRFILDLAVRGKLVPQDAHDEPASELLKRIAEEKGRLVKAGEIRRQELFDCSIGIEGPFEVPESWMWVPAIFPAYVVSDIDKKVQTKDVLETGKYPVVDQGKVFVRGYCDDDSKVIRVSAPLILFGDHTRETKLINFDFVVGADGVKLLQPVCLFTRYYYFALQWLPLDSRGYGRHFKLLRASFIPLPPLAEQRRIVAKVDELMALCNRLEVARERREVVRGRLAAASLARLNTPDPETFETDARFALDALPALTARPDQIKQLRQTILNLAVRGKLVPQDANDEPAPEFDRAIPAHLEPPFEIPRSWKWARLRSLGTLKGGGTPSKARDDYWNGPIPWVSPKDMKADYLAQAQLSITEAAITGSAANLIEAGSILFVVRGMILAHSFPVAVTRVPLAINQDMKALVLKSPEMAEFILRALKGLKPEMLKRVQRSSHGTCRIEGSDYSDFLIPVPPLYEQGRIVAKVNELMALCDRLESSLTTADDTRRRLLEALLAEALAPEEDRGLEAAE